MKPLQGSINSTNFLTLSYVETKSGHTDKQKCDKNMRLKYIYIVA
jgi:hypothetical protein